MTKAFVTRQTYDEGKPDPALARVEVSKALSKTTPWPGEAEIGLKGRVDHPSTDGVVNELAAKLKSFYASLPRDPRLLTESEKRALYDQIVAALSTEQALTESGKKLALLLAGLDSPGDSVASPPLGKSEMETFMADFRQKIATLREQVTKLVEARSKPERFVTKTTGENSAETSPDQLLRKALENGRPVFPR